MDNLIAIVGPTGAGKSDLAIKLARSFGGEIVNSDSRQFYRRLDIGTAKTPAMERAGIPHHLLDIIEPDENFNLADFKLLASRTIDEIHFRHGLPILVGGSGLYVWTMLEGWQIPKVPPNPALREQLLRRAELEGGEVLYAELQRLDAAAAARIDRRNIRRVIRALEIAAGSQPDRIKLSERRAPPYRIIVVGLTADRESLYRRVDLRVDKMIENGLIDEVRAVLVAGVDVASPSLQSVGYKEVLSYLKGELDLFEMAERIKAETHRLVRHQYNWFRLNDTRIHWFETGTDVENRVSELITRFLVEKETRHGFY